MQATLVVPSFLRAAIGLLAVLLVLDAAPAWGGQRITSVAGARVRATAAADGDLVMILPFGSVLEELARDDQPRSIAGVEDYWYRVALPGGADGWIFGALTRPFDVNQAASIYQELADSRLAQELGFADQVDLTNFLAQVKDQVMEPEAAGSLALAHLRSVQRSLESINMLDYPSREAPEYQQWLVELEAQGLLAYNESAGEYLLPLVRIWDLHDAFYPLPVSEEIAWLAVTNPWAGECEGYFSCLLDIIQRTSARYLKFHPQGAHAPAALANIASFLDPSAVLEVFPEELALANRHIAVLQASVARTADPGELPAQLEALRQRYLSP